ncbi:hypothetical protein AP75_13165 [Kaistella haifensis DSM 19056]|uniref:Uncharacterized protein n=1 Tax=Kaistella haifensis DSM 19056 TaxID=1450526 RepID=A0A246B6R9_9FLAO|nr:hypothetical protein [Kaistella haifensis]OWK97076.1 hypothetical protein AP75_13165 [Kaistella haifensis DSM 19056]
MNAEEILDEITKNILNVPQNTGYAETIRNQSKAVQNSQEIIKKELAKIYDKGFKEGVQF